jgi:hypothetical protein
MGLLSKTDVANPTTSRKHVLIPNTGQNLITRQYFSVSLRAQATREQNEKPVSATSSQRP